MTDAELLAKLVQGGCMFDTVKFGVLPVGWAELVQVGTPQQGIAWCTVYPQGPQDAHWTYCTRLEQLWGRDLMLWRGPQWVGYLCPWQEAEALPENYHTTLRQWQQWLASGTNMETTRQWLLRDNFLLTA